MAKVLVVDDLDCTREAVAQTLLLAGLEVETARSPREGLAKFRDGRYQAVVTDYRMPGMDGLAFLHKLREHAEGVPVIVITAYGSVRKAVQCLQGGACDYLTWPTSPRVLAAAVEQALRHRGPKEPTLSAQDPARQLEALREHIGLCPALREVYPQIVRVAQSGATVLIAGESGTGKELIADAIHCLSPRRAKPYLRVNCAALSAGLLESEMFGHERGAFTGADRMRLGRFELADGGSILLDEVAELDWHLQSKLLRVLQEKEFERVGNSVTQRVDVRVIATTNQDLARAVEEERFRRDLFFRLNVVPLTVAPLRERREDILPLAEHFLQEQAVANGPTRRGPPVGLSPELRELLLGHSWPGNVRELENLAARLHVLGRLEAVDLAEVRSWLMEAPKGRPGRADAEDERPVTLAELEREAVHRALAHFGGHRRRAAEALGISVRTLQNKVKQWGLL
jgi:DNA-binding NtrC family response regulator